MVTTRQLLHDYLSNRWNRTKINKQFSSWQELIQGVPQGSVLGLLLFNIYLNNLFYLAESTNVCNFADNPTIYACDKDLNSLINRLENDSYLAIEWFENNFVKLNQDKCHLFRDLSTKIFGQILGKQKFGKVRSKNF